MDRHLLFVFLILLFVSTFVCAIQESDDDSLYEPLTTPSSRQGRVRCPLIRNALKNGWVKMRSRGRIAKFMCNKGFELIGSRINTCIQGKWNNPMPVCTARGCQKIFIQPPNRVTELFRGSVLEFSCELGYSFEGSFPSYRIYCDGSQWRSAKSTGDLLEPNSHQLLPSCKMKDRNASLSCDFETSLCGWLQDPDDDFDWLRNQFATPSASVQTGPSHDNTLGPGKAGFYLYVETSSPRKPNDTARLFSPVYQSNDSDSCFVIHYHMYGKTTGSLKVYIKEESQLFSELHPVWMRSGDDGDEWKRVTVPIQRISQPFQIIIEAVRGSSYVGDTAIDDLALLPKNECSLSTSAITKVSHQWAIPTPQSQIANHDNLNTETSTITTEVLSTIMVSNRAITAKSETTMSSKISTTMTTMFVREVININTTSNESTSLSADDSKTLMSRITEDMNKSNAFTLTNINQVSTLTTTARPTTFQTKIALTDPTIQTSNNSNNSNTTLRITASKLVSNVSSNESRDTRPFLTSTPISTSVSKSTLVPKSTEAMLSSSQKPLMKVLNSTVLDISSTLTTSKKLTSSESKVQRIIESKTTAAMPITRDSSIFRKSNDSVSQRMNQTIAMRTTTSSTAVRKKTASIIVTAAQSNLKDKINFDNNTNRQTFIQKDALISNSTQSLFHIDSTLETTIIPIIRTTSTLRRRRKSGIKTTLAYTYSSNSVDKKLNTSFTIVIVPLILITIITLIVSLYFIRKRKSAEQDRLSEDSEMRYLSSNEI